MLKFRFFILNLFLFMSIYSYSQLFLNEVDLNKIEEKKIREYIETQMESNIVTVSDIEPSVTPESSVDGFRSCYNEYLVKDSLEKVWKYYKNSNPADAWNGRKVKFGLLLSKRRKKIVYKNDSIDGVNIGQIIYINLKLLMGIKNLATAFEFINIDDENRIIEFSYIKGNSSTGKQQIQFFETLKGHTLITHTSYYKCRSLTKNYLFYSFFHTRIINEYHRNMRRKITRGRFQ